MIPVCSNCGRGKYYKYKRLKIVGIEPCKCGYVDVNPNPNFVPPPLKLKS